VAFANMAFEIAGEINMPYPLAATRVNEALGEIFDSQMWSFQMKESGWLAPGLQFVSGTQSAGTITATAYSTSIVGDATASAAWAAYASLPLFTTFQIREPMYSLYNIVAYDGVSTITIDRPWMEPSGVGLAYMIYQAYFPAPTSTFKRFFAIRDTTNSAPIDYWSKFETDLMVQDPQREVFDNPAFAVPYQTDLRANSATPNYMLYELWPHPLSVLPYTISYLDRGSLLVNPSDTLPSPLTEEMVKWKAKQKAYLWKEAQRKEGSSDGPDWQFLAAASLAQYKEVAKIVMDRDRDQCEMYFRRFVRDASLGYWGDPFATINNGLQVGRW
jgi:hypothetical protein